MDESLAASTRERFTPGLATVAICVAIGMTAPAATASSQGRAAAIGVAARTVAFKEVGHMHLASAPGATLKESGSTTGTFSGTVVGYFTSYSVSRGSFTMTAYLSGGILKMAGLSHNRVSGATGYAEGTAHVTGGTGRFAHASGNRLQYKAVVNRQNFQAVTEMHGPLSL
jgi:hypothetical protein